MEQLFLSLNAIKPLSEGLESCLRQHLKMAKFKKGEFILRKGEKCTNICFIESGLIRIFQHIEDNNENTKEKMLWIQKEGEIFIDVDAFFRQTPSQVYIQALEDCVVWYITFDELEKICDLYPEFNKHASVIKSTYYSFDQERSKALNAPYKERYKAILELSPWLTDRVLHEYIASYMDMSTAKYFMIRRDIAKGK